MKQRILAIGLLAFGGALSASAGAKLNSSLPIAAMDQKPAHRWDVAAWLQLHDEAITRALHERSSALSGKEFIWSHVKVESQVLHGLSLIPGKYKFYVASVPTIAQGTLWAARDGKVITGYKRRVPFSENNAGFVIIDVGQARIASDKFIYADTILIYVDEEGKVYY